MKIVKRIRKNGLVEWVGRAVTRRASLHREDAPAIIWSDGRTTRYDQGNWVPGSNIYPSVSHPWYITEKNRVST